jgi:hypothetical protein
MMQVQDDGMSSVYSFGGAAQVASGPDNEIETRATGERRLSRRYTVGLAIRVRALRAGTASEWRVGMVLDLSSTGVSFQCRHSLPVNTPIEMVIDWPSKQDTPYPICLRASGHVVRSHHSRIAARMTSCRMGIEKASAPAVTAASTPSM